VGGSLFLTLRSSYATCSESSLRICRRCRRFRRNAPWSRQLRGPSCLSFIRVLRRFVRERECRLHFRTAG